LIVYVGVALLAAWLGSNIHHAQLVLRNGWPSAGR